MLSNDLLAIIFNLSMFLRDKFLTNFECFVTP